MTGWIAQTPALAPYRFTILDNYRQQGARARREGRAAAVARRPVQHARRATIYQELSTSDIKFPTIKLSDGKEVMLTPGQLRRAARDEPEPGRPRQGRGGARRHLRRDRQHLRRDLQRRAAARLVHGAGAQLPDHARRRARRQRDPARGGRDADRRDARRHGAVAALRQAAQEAARPARPTTSTTASCRSTAATRPTRTRRRASWRCSRSRRSARSTSSQVQAASSPAAASTSTRTRASAAAPTTPASTASARTCC